MAKQLNIYLDYAAATPLDPLASAAMAPFYSENFYNPSANYQPAIIVKKVIEKARSDVANLLGSRSNEIVFTAGGTEANNLAIHGVMRQFPKANIVVSSIEHDSVLKPASRYNAKHVKIHQDGRINLEDLADQIDDETVLVSVMYANSEIGTVQPIRQISRIISEKRNEKNRTLPLYFHVDACQAANYLDLHVSRLGVDLMSLNGGKIYGPKQSGALYVKAGIKLQPIIDGGGQEYSKRSGTENVPGIIGFAKALDVAQKIRKQEASRLEAIQMEFIDFASKKLPNSIFNGSIKYRLPNNVHLTFKGKDNERILMQLDQAGIFAAAGSACSASDDTPSHVLKAIGLTDEEARSSLRFSMGRSTTSQDIQKTVDTLAKLLK